MSRTAVKARREEIKSCLSRHGFARRGLEPLADSDVGVDRIAALLQELGPVFARFGLYLASRPDLLRLTDCVSLSAIPNRSAPISEADVRQVIRDELGSHHDDPTVEPRFVTFDPQPFETRLLLQLHNGQLENGDFVVVKVVHPHNEVNQELELLPMIAHVIAPRLTDPRRFKAVMDDFRLALKESLDCQRVAESLETLSHDCRDNESLCVPKVYHQLCTSHLLVTERLDGIRLDHHLMQCRDPGSTTISRGANGIVADELARLLCDVWLRQSFEGTLLLAEIRPENILIRSPTQVAVLDGTFASFPAVSRRNLLEYLISAATDEPSKALVALLKELDATRCTTSAANLDRQFRQVVSFREGGWEDGGKANCLSDTLFAQWRLITRSGYAPLRHLIHLYRGTFHITCIARKVAPQRDSLLEGVKDLRLTMLLSDIGKMMEPSYWGGQMDRLFGLMILGPQHLDDVLKKMSDEEESFAKPQGTAKDPSLSFNSLPTGLLLIAAFFMFRDQLSDLFTPVWAERLMAVLFVAIGAWTLQLFSDSS